MANAEPNLNPIATEADVEDQGPLAQQIAWEESHLGNFRKIMPPPDLTKLDYYTRFYAQSNQVSIFAETAASKKREDLARKMRIQIEEKKAKQQQMLNGKFKRDARKRHAVMLPRAVREKNRMNLFRLRENWAPGFISDAEERLRHTWLHMRSEAIRTLKITENVRVILILKFVIRPNIYFSTDL